MLLKPARLQAAPLLACLCVALVLASGASPALANVTLNRVREFSTGQSPEWVAAADFNEDGDPDVVTADSTDGTVSVLLGQGDLTLATAVPLAVGTQPMYVVAADLNGDQDVDIVTANQGSNDVSVLLGNGDGTFQAARPYATASEPVSIAVGHFDADANLDIVTGHWVGSAMSLLLGDGTGALGAATPIPIGPDARMTYVIAADLNADTFLDLVVNHANTFSYEVVLGNGLGGFASASVFPLVRAPRAIAVADFDEDTIPDVAMTAIIPDRVGVALGDGSGGFGAPIFSESYEDMADLIALDFDGDGHQDLIVGNSSRQAVTVLEGRGDATFEAPRVYAGGFPSGLSAADFDGDAALDVVLANEFGIGVSLLPGIPGKAMLRSALRFGTQSFYWARRIRIVDLDDDGFADVVTARASTDSKLEVRLGDGQGRLLPPLDHAIATGSELRGLAVGDVDGDGAPDAVTTLPTLDQVIVLLGDGDGTFTQQPPLPVGDEPNWIEMGDLNGDDDLDLVTTNFADRGHSVLLGNGDGTFQPATNVVRAAPATMPYSLRLADFDGDTLLDLVSARETEVWVELGDGSGGFGAPSVLTSLEGRDDLELADFDADGLLDVATVSSDGFGSLEVGFGDGIDDVTSTRSLSAGTTPRQLVVTDANADGKPDIATANGGSYPSILLGNADGTFQPRIPITTESSANFAVAAGELDRDGKPDLVHSYVRSWVEVSLGVAVAEAPTRIDFDAFPAATAITDQYSALGVRFVAGGLTRSSAGATSAPNDLVDPAGGTNNGPLSLRFGVAVTEVELALIGVGVNTVTVEAVDVFGSVLDGASVVNPGPVDGDGNVDVVTLSGAAGIWEIRVTSDQLDPGDDYAIDDVEVVVVPEAQPLALLGFGVALLPWLAHRRRRRGVTSPPLRIGGPRSSGR